MNYTKIANTTAGRYLLGEKSGYPIVKTTSNSYHMLVDVVKGRSLFVARFYTYNLLDKLFGLPLTKIDIARKHVKDEYDAFIHYANLDTKNYCYPQIYLADTFTANGGGQGRVGATNATYITAHDATTGTKSNDITRPTNATGFEIQRGFAPFDTSAIIDDATIAVGSSTFIRCLVTGKDDNDSDSISVVASTQASDTALVGDDYDNVGTTKFVTDKTIADITTAVAPGSANDFQLNASGIANISKTGYSKFAWRTAKDIASTAPTVGNNNIQMVDNTNLLSVEYSVAEKQGHVYFM